MKTLDKVFEPKKERKIYRYHDYRTPHLVLVPLMYICWWLKKIGEKKPRIETWSDKRTEKLLFNYLIKYGDVDKEECSISKSIRDWGHFWEWNVSWYNKYYSRKYKNKITEYFLNTLEINGYTKEVTKEYGWITVTFKKIGVDK